jgi:hypothetical protein
MSEQPSRFWYPFTATTVLARKIVPLLLFTLGMGLLLWAGREYYYWIRPWVVLPAGVLGLLCWLAAVYFFTLLPTVYADEEGLRVRRWGLVWRRIPWESVAGVRETARIDLLGWDESFYTVYRWRALTGRRGRIRREWHRREVRAFRFSGHIQDSQQLLRLIEERRDSSHQDDKSLVEVPGLWRRVPWVSMALFVGTLIAYITTLTPGVLGGDVGELQFVPYILGLAHPTGTPFYCILGKLWTFLPVGPSVAWRMNLLSAMFASLAVVVVYHLLYWRTRRILPSFAATLTFAFGLVFWEQATMADKYAFNALMVALVLYLTLRWGQTRSPATLNLLALTYGLSLTHHRTMVLFAPTLLGYVWWHEKSALWRNWRRLLRLAVLFLAPLLFYLYLPWAEARNLPPGTWHPQTLRDWYHYIMDTGQIGYLYIDPADLGERLLFYLQTLLRDFTWVGLLLGVGGMLWQLYRTPGDAVFLLANFLLQAFLAANHHLPRQWTFFIPSFMILALWVGEALGALWLGLERVLQKRGRLSAVLVVVLALMMLALPAVAFSAGYRLYRELHFGAGTLDLWRQAIKQGRMGERMGQAIAGVDQGAVIVADWEQSTPLWYYQQVEGWRPDVQILYPFERLEQAAASGRPLYVARTHPGLADRWHPSASGPLITLQPAPSFELPVDASPLRIGLGGMFELAGVTTAANSVYPGTVVPMTLYWRAVQTPAHDYSISLRLFDPEGQEVFKVDSQHPVLGTYPTSRWSAGEVVGDYYEIQLPADLPPGTYQWGVVLYRTLPGGGWENLKVNGGDAELALGGAVEVRER